MEHRLLTWLLRRLESRGRAGRFSLADVETARTLHRLTRWLAEG